MENRPSKISSLLANLPEIPRKKRTRREIVVEMESSMTESPQHLVISDERRSRDSNQKRKKSKKTQKTRKKRKPMPKPPILKLHDISDALRRKIEEMGGRKIVLGIQKQLSYTDVSSINSRLSIPCHQLIFEFLSKDEELALDGYVENSKTKARINALVIDPRMEEMELSFTKWLMDKTCVFNLIHNWNRLVKENGLEAGDTIQVWSFRNEQRRLTEGSDLCFAVVKLEEEGGDNNGGAEADAATLV